MDTMTLLDKILIPTYDDPDELKCGEVEFNYKKCSGCNLCVQACPSNSIVMDSDEKKPRLKLPPENECIFCGDCMAICPEGAISMKSSYEATRFFKNIGHGEAKAPRLVY